VKAAHYGIEDTRSDSVSYKKLCPGTYLPSTAVLAKKTDAQLREDFIEQERQLLYVSVTRARDAAFVTWSGKPSRFLQGRE
jgi:superfamily I DNA/RNA helicase